MTDTLERPDFRVVGTRPVRPDGVDKVTGRAAFGADLARPGMLVGRVKRSPHAHARILSVDVRRAEALAGVKAVVTGADFPDPGSDAFEGGESASSVRDVAENVMARGKALYEGHAVAAVAAVDAATADAALDLIEVTYEPLPHVVDVLEAMEPYAPVLHEGLLTEGGDSPAERASNIARRHRIERGDLAAAFAGAEEVVEGRFRTAAVHQGYIEPQACVAEWGADGQCQVWSSSQGQFMVRTLCAKILALAAADVRVTPMEIGGGFGGKTTVYLEPVALALSRRSGRPVKMVMCREEVFRATGPTSASVIDVRLAARRDGAILGAEVELRYQAGAFPGSPVGAAVMTALACYDLPAFRVTGWDVVTNTPKVAAYRAPGAPAAAFAVESLVDELARRLGQDPLELRRLNGVANGARAAYGPTYRNIAYLETLEAARSHPHYAAPLAPGHGRGVAVGFWFNVGGESTAAVHVTDDGGAVVVSGNPDIGGSRASLAMMAAEILGLPAERVRAVVADTAQIGFSMLTGGSRTTFATGLAVTRAAEKIVEELRRRAALAFEAPLEAVVWKDGAAHCVAGEPRAPLTLAELAAGAAKTGGPLSAEVSLTAQGAGPGFGAHICDVAVDAETGQVRVTRYTAVQDVGRAIHPAYVEGQLQGGAAQGIGWALNEAYVFAGDGRVENAGFLDYRMPVASDLPMIDTVLVESVPNPRHPFGAKGVGEVPIVPPLAAVANAVRDATGVRFHELPLSPPAVRAALRGR